MKYILKIFKIECGGIFGGISFFYQIIWDIGSIEEEGMFLLNLSYFATHQKTAHSCKNAKIVKIILPFFFSILC